MPITMMVRCNQCGHENNPEYRFCGMCGAPLPAAVATSEPERMRVSPVGGPSFLGLGDDRSSDLDYLMDDEPSRGHRRLYLVFILLGISGGLLAWHWQKEGYPWAILVQKQGASRPSSDSTATPGPVAGTAEKSAATPATSANAETPAAAGPEKDGVGSEKDKDKEKKEETAGATDHVVSSGSAATTTEPEPTREPAASATMEKPGIGPGVTSAETKKPGATEISAPKHDLVAPVLPRKPVVKVSPALAAAAADDRVVNEGERYLYGRGVRANCDLAQRNLMVGARQSNPKAQTLLGAMYATGHCASRDLPTAYRWFAKALHGDPSNSRVQRDLEVLWKQMTAEERQLAMKSQ